MENNPRNTKFIVYGFGAAALSLHGWNSYLVQGILLKLVRSLQSLLDWSTLRDLGVALPEQIDRANVLSGYPLIVAGIALSLCAVWLLKFLAYDFQISKSRFERFRLSVIFSFCLLCALMLASYLNLLAQVMLAGEAIKPFPKQAIGSLQYLDALAFLPWAGLCCALLFAFSEAAIGTPARKSTASRSKPPSNEDDESSRFMAAA